jgi:RNA polymerase sigma-70 factor (ECF subfamily)
MRPEIQRAADLLQTGDEQAVEQALTLLQQRVFSFSMRVCGQREDAEDTMQDVLLKFVTHLPKIDNAKALLVWLYKVAKNRCLMSRRKSKFAPRHELSLEELMPDRRELEVLAASESINPETFAIRSEGAGRLRDAIQKLAPQYRIVLVLRDMEGLTDDEVAEITGLRPGTVRVRLHRARLFVRKELMKVWGQQVEVARKRKPRPVASVESSSTARCKAMFAELSDYLDEKLDDSLCNELHKHLEGCEPCKAFVATLEATIQQCRTTPADTPDREQAAALRKKIITDLERALANTTAR